VTEGNGTGPAGEADALETTALTDVNRHRAGEEQRAEKRLA
jgi:hypothetical protein